MGEDASFMRVSRNTIDVRDEVAMPLLLLLLSPLGVPVLDTLATRRHHFRLSLLRKDSFLLRSISSPSQSKCSAYEPGVFAAEPSLY